MKCEREMINSARNKARFTRTHTSATVTHTSPAHTPEEWHQILHFKTFLPDTEKNTLGHLCFKARKTFLHPRRLSAFALQTYGSWRGFLEFKLSNMQKHQRRSKKICFFVCSQSVIMDKIFIIVAWNRSQGASRLSSLRTILEKAKHYVYFFKATQNEIN